MSRVTKAEVREKAFHSLNERLLFDAVLKVGPDWKDLWDRPIDYRDASTGIPGFTYYTETHKFTKDNILRILELIEEEEEQIGEQIVHPKDCPDIANWLAWFTLEWVVQRIWNYKEDLAVE